MDPRRFLSRMPPRLYLRPRPTVLMSRMPMSQPRPPVFGSSNVGGERLTSCSDLYQNKVRVYEPRSDSSAYTRQSKRETSLASFPSSTNVEKKKTDTAAPSLEKEDLHLKPQVPTKQAGNLVLDGQARNSSQAPHSTPETVAPQELTMKEKISRLLSKHSGIIMFSRFKKEFFKEYGIKFEVASSEFSDVPEMFSALEIRAIVKRIGSDDFSIIPCSKTPVAKDKIGECWIISILLLS